MKSAITLSGVCRSFGSNAVLKGVSATAAPGKVIGLLGRNAEGKSTLFQIMLDILSRDAGYVEVLGQRPNGSGEIRQSVGYIPEKPSFHEFMSAAEALDLRSQFFRNWSMDKAAALSCDLGIDLRTKIQGASKGTLGKLAWICAAAHDPELYLLDEPTSGLDALVREDILSHLIKELHDRGKTVLIANHRMEELSGILDEVWVLSRGIISDVYNVDDLRKQALHITGRLKADARIPDEIPAISLSSNGPLVELAVFDKKSVEKLSASKALEFMDSAPLPLETTLTLLLKKPGASHD